MAFPLLSQRSGSVTTLVSLAVATSVMLGSAGGCGRTKSGEAKTGLGGKDVSKAIFAEQNPPTGWKKATYGIVPGSGDSMMEFPMWVDGVLTSDWGVIFKRATAWGTIQFVGENGSRGRGFVVDLPNEGLTQRALGIRENYIRGGLYVWRAVADLGDEAFAYDSDGGKAYGDQATQSSGQAEPPDSIAASLQRYYGKDGWQVGCLVFRRGRVVLHLVFDNGRTEELLPYAKQLDARIQKVLTSSANSTPKPQPEEQPITWTRDDPRAFEAVANEGKSERAAKEGSEKARAKQSD